MFIFDSEDTKKGDPRWIAFDRLFHVVVVGLSHRGSRMVIATHAAVMYDCPTNESFNDDFLALVLYVL